MNDAPFDIAFTRKAGKDIKAIEEYLTTHSSVTIASKVVQKLFMSFKVLPTNQSVIRQNRFFPSTEISGLLRKVSTRFFTNSPGKK